MYSLQLENGYTFHDYNIKLNDVIQLMVQAQPEDNPEDKTSAKIEDIKQEAEVSTNENVEYKGMFKFNVLGKNHFPS